MDMLKKIETQPLTAAVLSAATDLCEAEGEMSPIEVATSRRMVRALEAAEKMADAIDEYRNGGDLSLSANYAADAFRKVMRGER